jgi:outer membrane protein
MSIPALSVAAEQKLGIIDVRSLLEKSDLAQQTSSRLQAEFEGPQTDLQSQEQRFLKKRAELERESATLSEADRENLEHELAAQQRELQVMKIEFNDKFNHRQQEELVKFMDTVKVAVDNYAKESDFDVILQSDVSMYFSDAYDVTSGVMAKLDASS